MRIEKIHIKNFRAFSDVVISLDSYTCFVGPNGAGKSTVLGALNVFFRDKSSGFSTETLSEDDFHNRNIGEPVDISLTFSDLNDTAKEEFVGYVRGEKLIVSAVARFDETTRSAPVKQFGKRPGISAFSPFFKAQGDGKKVPELQLIYNELRNTHPLLGAAKTGPAMTEQLRSYEAQHPGEQSLLDSNDQFYGFSGGARLEKYVQWVYVPAVKDVVSEQVEAKNTALGALLLRTARRNASFEAGLASIRARSQDEYDQLIAANQEALSQLSENLNKRMVEWAHPDAGIKLEWMHDKNKSVRIDPPLAHVSGSESGFEGGLLRFGHGFQRSYLIALLQELAEGGVADGPSLILGCEEPELYQHPPQARHLAVTLEKLASGNAQVLVSTHSPLFVSGEYFESVRMVRRGSDHTAFVNQVTFDEIAREVADATGAVPRRAEGMMSQIHQCLRPTTNEMFFAGHLVLVEGYEDVAYLASYMELLGLSATFRGMGGHVVPVGSKSLLPQTIVVAKRLGIPVFAIFDGDSDKTDKRSIHERDNTAILALLNLPTSEPFPLHCHVNRGVAIWPEDIALTVASEFGEQLWSACQQSADQSLGYGGNMKKHSLHIGARLAYGWEKEGRSASLESVCRAVIDRRNYAS